MATQKVVVLKAITPPGFFYKVFVDHPVTGAKTLVDKFNVCKVGDVIEIDEAELTAKYGVEAGYVERGIKAGIFAKAPANERVTKRATHGEFIDASSGEKESNPVPAKADAGDK
jgi:hypothetical protein